MSVLIRVEKLKPVEIDTIRAKISEGLRFILGLTYEPEVRATRMHKTEETLPGSYCLRPGSAGISISIEGEQARVSVFSREGVEHIVISPDQWRTELEGALAAAVAIALADYSGTEVSDSALAYTTEFSQPSNRFAESVRVTETFDNINNAAKAFFARLPKCSALHGLDV